MNAVLEIGLWVVVPVTCYLLGRYHERYSLRRKQGMPIAFIGLRTKGRNG
jgi:hypothetical protein